VIGIITYFDLSKAKMYDIEYWQDIRDHDAGCLLWGNRAFLSGFLQLELFETNDLFLKSPMGIIQ